MEERDEKEKELELYFHIPFCVRKCDYCDFLSVPTESVGTDFAPGDEETKRRYMEALLAETVGSAFRYGAYQVTSIFIGGGTPSVVPAETIETLLASVREHYLLAEDAEITIEANPGTVSREMLARFRKAGINRLSLGLQSADDGELKSIGRIHTWQQFQESFAAAREAGFDNINVDIMSALPGQTLSGYRNTLQKVLSLDKPPEHISAYSLILEEGTPLYARYEKGELELPDEDTDREMYQETKRILASAGYKRYEISNYAKKGYECCHNCGYWRRKDYVGFGIGAASLVRNVRFRNGSDLKAYLEDPFKCREEVQALGRQEQMEEYMFLGLRMTEGVSCERFEALFGCSMESVYGEVIRKNIHDGLLQYRTVPDAVWAGKQPCPGEPGEAEKSRRIVEQTARQHGRRLYPADGQRARQSGSPQGGGKKQRQRRTGQDRGKEEVGGSRYLALTDRGLDLSNYVMAQFLL